MSDLLPFRSDADSLTGKEPRVVEIDEDVADEVFSALSSQTARAILTALYDSPKTATELADTTDTTIQNVQYHLDKLLDVDLVQVADTGYSEKGREMKVYSPTDSSVVLFTSEEADKTAIHRLFRRLVGGFGLLAVSGIITRGVFAVVNALQRANRSDIDDGIGSPPSSPSPGVEIFSQEFLLLWLIITICLVLLYRQLYK